MRWGGRPRSRDSTTALLVLSLGPLTMSLGACQSLTFPTSTPTLEGEIVGIGNAIPFGGDRTIWVKVRPESSCGVVFTVVSGTDIGERHPDDSIEDRVFNDLLLGQQVRVWSSAVADSCPGQANADAIEIMFAVALG